MKRSVGRLLLGAGAFGLASLWQCQIAIASGQGTATISGAGLGTSVQTFGGGPGSVDPGPTGPVDTASYGSGEGGVVVTDSYGGATWMGTGQSTVGQACATGQGATQPTATAPLGSVVYVLVNSQGIPVGNTTVSCTAGPGGAGAVPPPPPPPPTAQQVWGAASSWEPLVASGIGTNPSTEGLTGLSSWFWLTNPTTVLPGITATVGGYTVTASASISSYTWTFGDGDSATAFSPGSASAPAATYTYQAKGRYPVSVVAHYVGSYTFTGFGLAPQTVPLAVDVTMGTLSYGVQEVRSVLIYPGSD